MTDTYKTDSAFFSYVVPIGSIDMYCIFDWMRTVNQARFRFIKDSDIETKKLTLKQVDELYPGVKTIAIVSNPWARMRMLYLGFTDQAHREDLAKIVNNLGLKLDSFESFVLNLQLVKSTADIPFTPATPQCYWTEYDGKQVDYILKSETLVEDFKVIQDYFCTDFPIHVRGSMPEYREHYTEEMKQAVAALFKDDIEKFGYSF